MQVWPLVQAMPQQSPMLCAVLSSQPFAAFMSQFANEPVHDATAHALPTQDAVPCMKPLVQSVPQSGPHAVADCVASQPFARLPSPSHDVPVHDV
jgi:hypothetical protein